jgi:hypothetical protein
MSGGGGSTEIKDTASQKALASIAAQRFNLYQQYYRPLENEFMSQVAAMKDPSAFESVEGYVNALQQPEFQAARANMQQQAFAMGADPTSGQYQARASQMQQAQARGMGLGTTEALSGQVDRYYQGMQNIIAMGQGQAGQAISGISEVGKLAQQRGIAEAKQSFQKGQAGQAVIGQGLGFGTGLIVSGGKGS